MSDSPISYYPDYPTALGDIAIGQRFTMLNYGSSIYMRVRSSENLLVVNSYPGVTNKSSLNDDGFHVPIVNVETGVLSRMSKIKPCCLEIEDQIRRRVRLMEEMLDELNDKRQTLREASKDLFAMLDKIPDVLN